MGKNLFNTVKMTRPPKNVFDLTHDVKLSCNMGKLVPTLVLECVPGDKFNITCESLMRLQPLVAPVMHRLDWYMHYWFVPHRLLWPNFKNFITNTKVLGALPAFPTLAFGMTDAPPRSLADYLGLPSGAGTDPGNEIVSALPFAAYQMICNEFYRDQNLSAPINFALTDGSNNGNSDLYQLRSRAWEHDYFTSALPFAQKGDAVTMPIGGFQDVLVRYNDPVGTQVEVTTVPDEDILLEPGDATPNIGDDKLMYAETSNIEAGSTTINDLRRATRLQEWLEKAARGGSRYIESILNHFGVRSSDKRLQRPEYITGTASPIVISEVLNTTGTDDAPQGQMAGHGVAVTSGKYGSYFCEEHGYIIGIMSVLPKTAYQQGIPRHFLKSSPFDFYWPSFANIGEQEIYNKEIYAWQGGTGDETFGYTPRYAEYKYMANRVAGDFRGDLDFWHFGRKFATPPQLNQTFIEADPTLRTFAVTDPLEDHVLCQILHKIRAVRPMPKYGTPTF